MIFDFMDPELKEINRIKDIEFIKIYDLTTNDKDKIILLPALMVSYDNGKIINLSIKDKYFKEFVNKVIQVYNNEKRNVIENDSTSPLLIKREIDVDPRTKTILDNANFDAKESLTSFYRNKDGFDNSLMYEQDEIKSIIDIIRFAIMDFAKFANLNVELRDNIKGYQTNYIIEANINGLFNYLLVHYDKKGNDDYVISIGNMGGANKPLIIKISFTDDSVFVEADYQDYVLLNFFNIKNQKGTYSKEIYKNDQLISFDTGDLEECKEFKHTNLFYDDTTDRVWFLLPWDAYLGESSSKQDIDGDTNIYHSLVTYLDINEDNYTKREFYTQKLERRNTLSRRSLSVTLDEFRKITFGYEQRPFYIIETYFRDARGDGEYQEKLNGKYFYHIVKAKNLKEIKKENLKEVKKEIINEKADLLSDVKLKKIGGRK